MIKIKKEIIQFIKKHGFNDKPIEACGYLAGNNDVILKAIKMKNIDNSPEHFSFDIKEQFKVLKDIRKEGLDLIGVYHTHPNSPARMSEEDIRLANDVNFIYLIYSLINDDLKCYKVSNEKFVIPIEIEVI